MKPAKKAGLFEFMIRGDVPTDPRDRTLVLATIAERISKRGDIAPADAVMMLLAAAALIGKAQDQGATPIRDDDILHRALNQAIRFVDENWPTVDVDERGEATLQ